MRPNHLETIPIARLHDPAFAGLPLEVLAEYGRTRDPEAMPEAAPGTDPVIFHCRRLTRSQVLDFVEHQTTEKKRFVAAFMAGVARVTGGRFGAEGWEPAAAHSRDFVAMAESEVDGADFSIACMVDVGSVVYMRSVAPKDYVPRFPLQPSSLHVWEGLDHRSAEQNRGGALGRSGEPEAG